MGKGSARRPRLVSREQEDLNWQLLDGDIDRATYDKEMSKIKRREKRRRDEDG